MHYTQHVYASGGVTRKLGAMCFYSRPVQVDRYVLQNPARTQSTIKLWARLNNLATDIVRHENHHYPDLTILEKFDFKKEKVEASDHYKNGAQAKSQFISN